MTSWRTLSVNAFQKHHIMDQSNVSEVIWIVPNPYEVPQDIPELAGSII